MQRTSPAPHWRHMPVPSALHQAPPPHSLVDVGDGNHGGGSPKPVVHKLPVRPQAGAGVGPAACKTSRKDDHLAGRGVLPPSGQPSGCKDASWQGGENARRSAAGLPFPLPCPPQHQRCELEVACERDTFVIPSARNVTQTQQHMTTRRAMCWHGSARDQHQLAEAHGGDAQAAVGGVARHAAARGVLHSEEDHDEGGGGAGQAQHLHRPAGRGRGGERRGRCW